MREEETTAHPIYQLAHHTIPLPVFLANSIRFVLDLMNGIVELAQPGYFLEDFSFPLK